MYFLSHFRWSVTTHKLNFESTSQIRPATHASSRHFSGRKDRTREDGGNRAYLKECVENLWPSSSFICPYLMFSFFWKCWPQYWLSVPIFFPIGFVGVTWLAVVHISFGCNFIDVSCTLLMCQINEYLGPGCPTRPCITILMCARVWLCREGKIGTIPSRSFELKKKN